MRVSPEVPREFMVFPRTLGRLSGVLERVRGDLTILLFLQPLLCDWHVLHGPKGVCVCARCRIRWKMQIWQQKSALGRPQRTARPIQEGSAARAFPPSNKRYFGSVVSYSHSFSNRPHEDVFLDRDAVTFWQVNVGNTVRSNRLLVFRNSFWVILQLKAPRFCVDRVDTMHDVTVGGHFLEIRHR